MPSGLVRFHQTGNFHFLTFSCYHRRNYLGTATARCLFEVALESVRLRYCLVVAGYVVMPEHVHMLVSEPRIATLARVIQALKISVTRRRKERPFWSKSRKSGCGRVTDITPAESAEQLRLNQCGRQRGVVTSYRKDSR
jgi:REP element-mobilizing transposase RayT